MGTYISVTCTSATTRDRILAFLNEHYQDIPRVMPNSGFIDVGPPRLGKEVCAYAKRATDIGYYVSAGWSLEARAWVDNLLRWIALRVGKTKVFGHEWIPGHPSLTLHYTCYEDEPLPIVVQSDYPNVPDPWEHSEGYARCDQFGWDRAYRGPPLGTDPAWDATLSPALRMIREAQAAVEPLIRAELERLNALWYK